MQIKITDGGLTGKGVKIVDSDTGEMIKNVRRATIHLVAGEINKATLEFVGVELDATVQAELCKNSRKFVNNIRKEMQKIEEE